MEDEENLDISSVVGNIVRKITKHNIIGEVVKALENQGYSIQKETKEKQQSTSKSVPEAVLQSSSNTEMIEQLTDKGQESMIGVDDAKGGVVKWWQGLPKNIYFKVDGCPLEIFLPDDKENFIETVIRNYQMHSNLKDELDVKNADIENSDLKFNQFSDERDQPFIDEYLEYVSNFSTKEILNLFSVDGQEQSRKKNSNTAKQYSYRIIELFHYLAKSYYGFHFDWFLD